jgi:hypothetical protein
VVVVTAEEVDCTEADGDGARAARGESGATKPVVGEGLASLTDVRGLGFTGGGGGRALTGAAGSSGSDVLRDSEGRAARPVATPESSSVCDARAELSAA